MAEPINHQSKQTLQRLDKLYARIPKFTCRPGCSECCGPTVWSRLEWERLPGDMRKAAKSIDCPYITAEHRCEVYELRPLICRLMGVVGKMLCPYSRAEIILTKEEEDAIHKAYSEVFNQ